jgi:(p)ppGpp synthase/HD superfamily hydrolase
LPEELARRESRLKKIAQAKAELEQEAREKAERERAEAEAKLAERLGGSPGDHTSLALALWAITHGTATILISKSIPAEHAEELRSVCSSAVKAMVRNASVFDWHG